MWLSAAFLGDLSGGDGWEALGDGFGMDEEVGFEEEGEDDDEDEDEVEAEAD